MDKIEHCNDQFQADSHRIPMIQSVLMILHIDKQFEHMDYIHFMWNLFYLLLLVLVIETKILMVLLQRKRKQKNMKRNDCLLLECLFNYDFVCVVE